MVGYTDLRSLQFSDTWSVPWSAGHVGSINGSAAMSPTQPTGWVGWHAALPICSFCGRWGYDRRLDHKSRMGCELHVRFREGLGVKLPRATRLVIGFRDQGDAQ